MGGMSFYGPWTSSVDTEHLLECRHAERCCGSTERYFQYFFLILMQLLKKMCKIPSAGLYRDPCAMAADTLRDGVGPPRETLTIFEYSSILGDIRLWLGPRIDIFFARETSPEPTSLHPTGLYRVSCATEATSQRGVARFVFVY